MENFLLVIRNLFLNEKGYLSGNSSKCPVATKRDKIPHMINFRVTSVSFNLFGDTLFYNMFSSIHTIS